MRWCIQSDEEGVLFGAERGCAEFEQRVLRFDAPGSDQGPSADDEVLYVLRGRGTGTIGGRPAALWPGAGVHLPAKLVHSLENHGPGEMQVLGVFRPAGSPAEAYYPDGTPAVQY